MRSRVVVSLGSALLLAACESAPHDFYVSPQSCVASQPDPAVARSCLASPAVRDYLAQAQQKVLDAWRVPGDIKADQELVVTFRLRRDGSLECLSVPRGADESLSGSVLSAFQRAAPFSALPADAACLGELPVTATFSNSTTQ